jgi:hypothetical protein
MEGKISKTNPNRENILKHQWNQNTQKDIWPKYTRNWPKLACLNACLSYSTLDRWNFSIWFVFPASWSLPRTVVEHFKSTSGCLLEELCATFLGEPGIWYQCKTNTIPILMLEWSIEIPHLTSKNVPKMFNGVKRWTFGRPWQHSHVVLYHKIPGNVRSVGSSIVMLKFRICAHPGAERKNNRQQRFVSVMDTIHYSIQSNNVGSMVVGYAAPNHHRSIPIGIILFDGTLLMTFMKASPNAEPTNYKVQIESRLIAEHSIAPMSKLLCLILCIPCSSETSVFNSHLHSHNRMTWLLARCFKYVSNSLISNS